MPVFHDSIRRLLTGSAIVLFALSCAGCGDGRSKVFDVETDPVSNEQRKEVAKEIAQLAKGKDPSKLDDDVIYDHAVSKLTARGAAIEPQLIEALGGSDDWAVRFGVIEVLNSVGTRACVDSLILALDDPKPLVALRAQKLLQIMCKHQEIPDPGQPTGANKLPPVPQRDASALANDTEEKLWAEWHKAHGADLHAAWRTWWQANQKSVVIE